MVTKKALLCGVATISSAATFSWTSGVPGLRGARNAPLALSTLRMNGDNIAKIVVCTGPTCSRTGGGKKLKAIVDEMAAPFGIEVGTMKCVSDCAECGLGPNIGVTDKDADGPFAEKIINGVKTPADVARILGVPEPAGK
jgi:hypothetical protein